MSKNKRGVRRGRRRRGNGKRRSRAFSGGKIKCPSHPPQFIPVPWYNLIIRFDNIKDLTVAEVIEKLDKQLGLAAQQQVGVRLISGRFWAPLVNMNANAHLSELRVGFWSLLPASSPDAKGNFTIQQEVFDYPDQVRRASVGFVWPKSQQQVVFNRLSIQPVLNSITGGGAGSVVYLRLLWRGLDTMYKTMFDGQRFINPGTNSETPLLDELSIDSPEIVQIEQC